MARSGAELLLANPSFRAHLMWVVTGTSAALLVVSSLVILLPLFLRFEGGPATPEELGRLADRILALHETLWPVVVMCLVAVMASSWLLYQRMVSPLVRFVQVFDAVRDGQIPGPVRLRGADYLTREADALNEMTAALRERCVQLAAARMRLCEPIEELAEWAATHGDEELSSLLATLQDREKALADQLSRVVAG
jgi:methyl-accepting chemotaxis protein